MHIQQTAQKGAQLGNLDILAIWVNDLCIVVRYITQSYLNAKHAIIRLSQIFLEMEFLIGGIVVGVGSGITRATVL